MHAEFKPPRYPLYTPAEQRERIDRLANSRPPKPMLGDFILAGTTALLVGEGGTGKTYFALQFALSVMFREYSFCGQEIGATGGVFYVDSDMGEWAMANRVRALMRERGWFLDDTTHLQFWYDVESIVEGEEFAPAVIEERPALIVIDNLRDSTAGLDMDNNSDAVRFFAWIRGVRKQISDAVTDGYQPTILLVHHAAKHTNGKLRSNDVQSGAGAITNAVDSVFHLSKSEIGDGILVIQRTKSRFVAEQEGVLVVKMLSNCQFEYVNQAQSAAYHLGREKEDRSPTRLSYQQTCKSAVSMFEGGQTPAYILMILNLSAERLAEMLERPSEIHAPAKALREKLLNITHDRKPDAYEAPF
jgi:hypothetical protein